MLPTYKAILRGDQLEWQGDRPEPTAVGPEVEVHVTLLGAPAPPEIGGGSAVGFKMR